MARKPKTPNSGPAVTRVGRLVRYSKPALVAWLVESTDSNLDRQEAEAFYRDMLAPHPDLMDTPQAAQALGVSRQLLESMRVSRR